MTDPVDGNSIAFALGKIEGQMREVIHAQGNMAQKIDLLTERALLAPTSAQIDGLTKRVDVLEAEKDRADGAKGMLATVLGSKAFGVLISVTLIAYASIKEGLFK